MTYVCCECEYESNYDYVFYVCPQCGEHICEECSYWDGYCLTCLHETIKAELRQISIELHTDWSSKQREKLVSWAFANKSLHEMFMADDLDYVVRHYARLIVPENENPCSGYVKLVIL